MNIQTVKAPKKVDNNTAKGFQNDLVAAIESKPDQIKIDLVETTYLSSAGLRAFLFAEKAAKKAGVPILICNVCESVMEVFDITGYSGFLNFEED